MTSYPSMLGHGYILASGQYGEYEKTQEYMRRTCTLSLSFFSFQYHHFVSTPSASIEQHTRFEGSLRTQVIRFVHTQSPIYIPFVIESSLSTSSSCVLHGLSWQPPLRAPSPLRIILPRVDRLPQCRRALIPRRLACRHPSTRPRRKLLRPTRLLPPVQSPRLSPRARRSAS